MNPTGESPYTISYTDRARDSVRGLRFLARERGLKNELLHAIYEIEYRLKSEPTEFGEPLYRLGKAGLSVRVGVARPVVVMFGVDEKRKIVYVQDFAAMFPES